MKVEICTRFARGFVAHGVFFLSLTEFTDDTEFFSRILLSPTDFLTRLLLCSAIRVNSIALAYRNNSQIALILFFFFFDELFDFVKNRSSDDTDVYSLRSLLLRVVGVFVGVFVFVFVFVVTANREVDVDVLAPAFYYHVEA